MGSDDVRARAEFEAWQMAWAPKGDECERASIEWDELDTPLARLTNGHVVSLEDEWEAWQASRAALAVAPATAQPVAWACDKHSPSNCVGSRWVMVCEWTRDGVGKVPDRCCDEAVPLYALPPATGFVGQFQRGVAELDAGFAAAPHEQGRSQAPHRRLGRQRRRRVMGMYDHVRCNRPLPDGSSPVGREFQTKDTDSQLLDDYTIREDGALIHHTTRIEDTPKDKLPYPDAPKGSLLSICGIITRAPTGDVVVPFHGRLRFYDEGGEYEALYDRGRLIRIDAVNDDEGGGRG